MTAKTDPKRRPGRPPSPDSMPSKVEARVSLEQRATWDVIDGPNWLRKALDAERRKLDKARAPSTVRPRLCSLSTESIDALLGERK